MNFINISHFLFWLRSETDVKAWTFIAQLKVKCRLEWDHISKKLSDVVEMSVAVLRRGQDFRRRYFYKLQGYADLYSVVMRAQLQSVSRIKDNSRYWKRYKTRPATGLYSDGPSQVCIYLPFCSVVLGNGRLIEWNIFLIFGIAKPPDSVLHLIKAFRLLVIMLKSKERVCVGI